MPSDTPDAELDGQIVRLITARQKLERAVATVLREAADVQRLDICGTDELPTALAALRAAEYVDSEEDAARRVARAFTAHPTELLHAGAGDHEVALCGAVMMLRTALADLDQAASDSDPIL